MSAGSGRRDRRETNPAFSSRRLKLGTFQTNLDSGCVMSDLDGPARHHLAQHGRARQAGRGDGVRGARAGRALAGLRRRHQPAGPRLRGLYLGRRHRRLDQQARRVRHLAHLAQSSDRRRQAIDGDRPYFRRPLRAQHRDRMEPAGNRHVRQSDAGARGTLRLRRGMDQHRQAALDRGRYVRSRGPVLQDHQGLPAAQADPSPLSRGHERRRLRARAPVRGEICRPGLYRDPHRRSRRMPRARAGLPQARARELWPRGSGLDARQHRARARPKRRRATSTDTTSTRRATGRPPGT